MFKTIKGVYENGKVTPLEPIPEVGRWEVLVTFLEPPPEEDEQKRLEQFRAAAGSWSDVDADELKRVIYESRGHRDAPK